MPYTINKTNGTLITTVQDGTVDTSSLDITLVGQNFSGYGNTFNENFVQMLENFANISPPLHPLYGQLYYNTTLRKICVYTGIGTDPWKSVGIIENSNTIPTGNSTGNLWWKTDEGRLYGYTGNGNNWTLIGPITSNTPLSGAIESTILRSTTGSDIVVKIIDNGIETAIFSGVDNTINGNTSLNDPSFSSFPFIKEGITLPANSNYVPGVSYWPLPNGSGGYILWGTASSALGLVSESTGNLIYADQYLQVGNLASLPSTTISSDLGILIGSQGTLRVHVTDQNIGNITNVKGSSIRFNIGTTNSTSTLSSSYYNVFSITTGSNNDPKILPNPSASVYIGGPTQPFSYVYANTGTFSSVYGSVVNDNNNRVLTSFSVNVGYGLDLGNSSLETISGPTGSFSISNTGILSVAGTNNQINITGGQHPVFSLPQNIDTTATVNFQRVNATSIFENGSQVLTAASLNSYGVSYIAGTNNQINVSNATGAVTLSLPQSIDTNATVSFQRLNATSIFENGFQVLTAATLNSYGVSYIAGTNNQINVSNATGAVTLSLPQNIDTNATVNFQRLNATSIFENGSEVLTRSSISGTTNQVNVDSSAGSGIRISLPQNIDTTSNPTFNTVTASLIGTASDATKLNGQNASYYQQALNFTPIQQGGGSGQTSNTIKIGWSPNGLKAQIDISDQGFFWLGQQATSSFSPNGFQILPSGLIIQWGNTNINGFVSFPMAFPNNCLSISGSGNGMFVFPGNPWEFAYSLMASNLTKTGFTNNNPGPGGGSGGYNQTQYYIAIGN